MISNLMVSGSSSELLAFNLGILTNELMWHYDQAVYSVNKKQQLEALTLIERLRATVVYLPSAPTTLLSLLDRMQSSLKCVDAEDLHETAITKMYAAGDDRAGGPLGAVWYRDEMSSSVYECRQELSRAVITEVLKSPRLEYLFMAGVLIDCGRHPQNVAEEIFSYEEFPASPGTQDWPKKRPILRTFHSGQLAPEFGWVERVRVVFNAITSESLQANQVDLDSPESRSASVEAIQSAVRNCLSAQANARQEDCPPTPETPVPADEPDAQSEVVDLNPKLQSTSDPAPNIKVSSSGLSESTEFDAEREEVKKHGSWSFKPGEVKFRNNEWEKITPQAWEILKCLASHRNPVSKSTLIENAWRDERDTDDRAVLTGLTRLRQHLKRLLGQNAPEEPIVTVNASPETLWTLNESIR